MAAGRQDGALALTAIGIGLAGYLVAALFLQADFMMHFAFLAAMAYAAPDIAAHELASRA